MHYHRETCKDCGHREQDPQPRPEQLDLRIKTRESFKCRESIHSIVVPVGVTPEGKPMLNVQSVFGIVDFESPACSHFVRRANA